MPRASNRSLSHIVAPGRDIQVPHILQGLSFYRAGEGTSYAAPHVTGAAVLLAQYAKERALAEAPGWDERTPIFGYVLKAVLLNSADKFQDTGNGLSLDMEKTILKRDGAATWTGDTMNPLDDKLGTGQLNVRRALNQFSSGQLPRLDVPVMGWTSDSLDEGQDVYRRLRFDRPLKANSKISITLTWNRNVSLIDDNTYWWNEVLGGRRGLYDAGDFQAESFSDAFLPNLDLYLLPRGATTIDQAVFSSRSSNPHNVEHIFATIQQAGDYEIWVRRPGTFQGSTPYAVAWWAVGADQDVPGRVGSNVWHDLNENGLQDGTEGGVRDVRVYLYKSDGKYVATTLTDAIGDYEFRFVPAGNYYVSFLRPDGWRFTQRRVGMDQTMDSDADANGYSGVFTVGGAAK